MKTITIETINFIELAVELKKRSFTYEFCSFERVRESDMNEYISEIENSIIELSDEQLAKILESVIDDFDIENVNENDFYSEIEDKNYVLLKSAADRIGYEFVENFKYKTVTFIL